MHNNEDLFQNPYSNSKRDMNDFQLHPKMSFNDKLHVEQYLNMNVADKDIDLINCNIQNPSNKYFPVDSPNAIMSHTINKKHSEIIELSNQRANLEIIPEMNPDKEGNYDLSSMTPFSSLNALENNNQNLPNIKEKNSLSTKKLMTRLNLRQVPNNNDENIQLNYLSIILSSIVINTKQIDYKKRSNFAKLFSIIATKINRETTNNLPVNSKQLCILHDKSSIFGEKINQTSNELRSKSNVFAHIIQPKKTDNKGCLKKIIECLKFKEIKSLCSSFFHPKTRLDYAIYQKIKTYSRKYCKKLSFILDPNSAYRLSWDIITIILINYQLLIIPFQISFKYQESEDLKHFDIFVDIFFIFDMIMSINTGYFDENGLVMNRKKIIINYLKCWFWIDLISCFPYSWLDGGVMSDSENIVTHSNAKSNLLKKVQIIKVIRLLRLMKILRLLRIFKLTKIFRTFEGFAKISLTLSGIINILKSIIILLYIAHWIGCLWHYVGINEFSTESETWLSRYGIENEPWDIQYIASIYWAVTTMITLGYGDIIPVTNQEKIVAIFTMIMSCGVFAFMMNRMNYSLEQIDHTQFVFTSKMRNFVNQLKRKDINPKVITKIKRYMEHYFAEQKSFSSEETKLFSLLSSSLKTELITQINAQIIAKIPFLMNNFSKNFLAALTYVVHELICGPSENVWNDITDDKSLYYIYSGEIGIFFSQLGRIANILTVGSHFGEIAFFTGLDRKAFAKSKEYTRLFKIPRQEFLNLLDKYPKDKEKFHRIKDNILLYKNNSDLKIYCYSCKASSHLIGNCPIFHFLKNEEYIINKYLENEQAFYKKFKRKHRKKAYSQIEIRQKIILIRKNLKNNFIENKICSKTNLENMSINDDPQPSKSELALKQEGKSKLLSNKLGAIIAHRLNLKNLKKQWDEPKKQDKVESKQEPKKEIIAKKKTKLYLTYDIDTIANFEFYFPHNNLKRILTYLDDNNHTHDSFSLLIDNKKEPKLRERFEREYQIMVTEFHINDDDDNLTLTTNNYGLTQTIHTETNLLPAKNKAKTTIVNPDQAKQVQDQENYPRICELTTFCNDGDKINITNSDNSSIKQITDRNGKNIKKSQTETMHRRKIVDEIHIENNDSFNQSINPREIIILPQENSKIKVNTENLVKLNEIDDGLYGIDNDNNSVKNIPKMDFKFKLNDEIIRNRTNISTPIKPKLDQNTMYIVLLDKLIEKYGINQLKAYMEKFES